eukprot:TRINITY_DN1671_c0_g1_i3.p1 TRINITY_DN1671_c0_g1~~TRINITY_DN1671_c0_g1_i3.p1  ORF type:complete len:245 (-),score=53.23 TRINITY_DN1671_c0_g1_i3:205-939(-)
MSTWNVLSLSHRQSLHVLSVNVLVNVRDFFFFFFNDTATTEIYTRSIVGSVRCVQETGINAEYMGMPNVVNLHKRAVPLEKNLVLVGLGGCPPAKKDDKDVLEGFPYKDDSEFKKDADTCVEAALKQFGTETDVVLLTHLGPDSSATTKVQLETEKLEAGSKGLSETIKKNADNIICNIHGHSALAEGFDKPYSPKLPIINPGGLASGRFAEVTLANLPSGRWRVASMKFNSFPSFQTHGSFHL